MGTFDPIDPDDNELATRMKESRETTFKALQDPESDLDNKHGFTFQEFSRRVDEKRKGALSKITTEESAAFAVLNDVTDGRAEEPLFKQSEQRTVDTTGRALYSARRYNQEERSQAARARDRATNADTVTGDFERWRSAPGQVDFPGIDTRGNVGPQLAGAERSAQTAAETPAQREANVSARNNDAVMLEDQAAAGVDDDELNRDVLFGAQAEQGADVSLAPEEGLDGRHSDSQSNFAGGPVYNSKLGKVVETDRIDQEQRPPEQALESQQEANVSARNNDAVMIEDQAAAGVDDKELNQEILFGAQAESADVSASPGEAFDFVGSGHIDGERRTRFTPINNREQEKFPKEGLGTDSKTSPSELFGGTTE